MRLMLIQGGIMYTSHMHLLPIFSLSVGLSILVGILVLKIIVSRNTRCGCKRKGE